MKFIAILFPLVAFVTAIDQESFKLRPENVKNVQIAGEKCASEFKLDPAILPRIADGTLPQDEISNKYVFCIANSVKLLDAEGGYIVEKVASYLGDHPLVEKFKEEMAKCNEDSKGPVSPVERFAEIYRCYFANSPVLFAL